jgi:endo-1,4-beta-xylanase
MLGLGAATADDSILLGEADYPAFHLEGTDAAKVELSVEPLHELGAATAIRLKVKEPCAAPYAAQIDQHNRQPIHKGDVLLAHFYLRTLHSSLESEEGQTALVLEDAKSFTKSLDFHASALGEWREFFVPFLAGEDYAPGQASIIFRAGYQPQEIEIAGLTMRDFGAQENLATPPVGLVRLQYAGQEPNAPWRAEAEQRIEKIRKADLNIQVVDGSGHPVPGVALTVQQTRHAFWFGSAVRADALVKAGDPAAQEKYRAMVAENFNAVTFENDLKWPFWQRDFAATLAADKWLADQGIALRGHVMVWPSHQKGLPQELFPLLAQPDKLQQAILDHIREETTQLQPPAAAWDVLNEPFSNHEFMDVLGRDAMPSWFVATHEDAPQSRLFINDWGIVTSRGTDSIHQADYEKNIAFLLDHHAPLDGIGVQGHFGVEPTSPELMLKVLDRFGKFGKEIQMTEYSTQFSDPKDAAAYLRDCLTVFFSHPSTSGFVLWGFHDGVGMKNRSFLYDKDWNLTPSGQVWKDLVYGRWWTQAQAVSAADGGAKVNGFLGQYKITASDQGVQTVTNVELKPGGSTIKIILPANALGQKAPN